MARKMRKPLEREHDLRETAALYLRGLTQMEIAQRLNVSRQQIGYDLKLLHQRWRESALADFDAKKAAELAKMDELERTYWVAWERSCQAREVTTQEKTQGGEGQAGDGRLKAGVRTEQRDGNPEFLRGIERCIELRCKIIGAFAAVKIAPTTPDGEEQWHASDTETNTVLLAAFFGQGGDSVWMQPPFFCDYGSNILLGKRVFFNFNCVVLDVCVVKIGDFKAPFLAKNPRKWEYSVC
jgi:hypothetical protein